MAEFFLDVQSHLIQVKNSELRSNRVRRVEHLELKKFYFDLNYRLFSRLMIHHFHLFLFFEFNFNLTTHCLFWQALTHLEIFRPEIFSL